MTATHRLKPKIGVISKLEVQQGVAATYTLESQGHALSTLLNPERQGNHLPTGELRMGIISRLGRHG